MELSIINIYIFILATVLAILEIQIEGQYGWAKNLPAWRPDKNKLYVKLFSKAFGEKELTGYHVTLISLLVLFFHFPFVLGYPLTWHNFVQIFSLFLLFTALWDFLWFVLNPHYPIRTFKKENVEWHKNWFLGLPLDYYAALIVSFWVIGIYQLFSGENLLIWWITNVGLFIIETLLLVGFSLYILKIDNWNNLGDSK